MMRWLAVLMLLCGGPAHAGDARVDVVMSRMSPADVEAVLRAQGLLVEHKITMSGSPFSTFKLEGVTVVVGYYGCEHDQCTSLQLRSAFDVKKRLPASVANDWNNQRRYGTARIDDEGDPVISYDLDLSGGASEQTIIKYVEMYRVLLGAYKKHIGW